VGGTGKTPLVMTVCRLLLAEGIRPVVVSRGYMRTDEQKVVVVGDGREVLVPPTEAGDEPWMMARGLAAPVIVGADRYRASLTAIGRFEPQVIVLDDGFQHRQLARDLDLVVLDAAAPLGVGRFLPRGDLREPAMALRRASALVLSGPGPAADLAKVTGLELPAPRFRSRIMPSGLYRFEDNASLPLDLFHGQRVLALAALGRPERFADTLQSLGADVFERRFFPDHHFFSAAELNEVAAAAAGAGLIVVTTTKDAARLVGVYPPAVETWVLEVEAAVEPRDEFVRLLKGVID
ncbi:MAG: tetraacyldisaccharide 4'-kinase, partial [Proteobacteria bacterium]|nr:tetraacyldisaccharide 4'-kinase [Pseudomonadota bacterium]